METGAGSSTTAAVTWATTVCTDWTWPAGLSTPTRRIRSARWPSVVDSSGAETPLELSYVGQEMDGIFVWIYQEIPVPEDIRELVLRCLDNIVRTKSQNLRSGWKIISTAWAIIVRPVP